MLVGLSAAGLVALALFPTAALALGGVLLLAGLVVRARGDRVVGAGIAAEMHRNFYTLQLCLYSVALHRYLRLRKPGYDFAEHFGGAFYVFLRGIDPAQPENGVHFQRLTQDFVERLSSIFEA